MIVGHRRVGSGSWYRRGTIGVIDDREIRPTWGDCGVISVERPGQVT